jgi:hypothetical protein
MNCKPGDLAVVLFASKSPKMIGRIVECVRLVSPGENISGLAWSNDIGGPAWLVRTTGSPLQWVRHTVDERAIADCCLRPIRDPGDDARDESLSWLPVPSREEVSA